MEKKNFKKKTILFSLISILSCGLFVALGSTKAAPKAMTVEAAQTNTYPGNGRSGDIMLINGQSTYFNTGQADVAIYCFNSTSDNAWSERYNYRVNNDLIRVMIPYQNGNAKTWAKFIICRYNPGLDPRTSGWDGVYNKSADISFADCFYPGKNTIDITGYDSEDKLTYGQMRYVTPYYGISGGKHMYLDLSRFDGWDSADAKFGIWFANPSVGNSSSWGLANSKTSGYYSSLCWKVEGQTNPHLYECIVPGNSTTLWNMVIAIRFNSVVSEPTWDNESVNIWNRTQNLTFLSSNHQANMIYVNNWNASDSNGHLDKDNVIAEADRVNFYGKYFLDTVTCSGTGKTDATTSSMWDAVKYAYETHLSNTLQGEVWKAVGDEEGTDVQKAMARYDYIVFYKGYDHEDFINRQDPSSGAVHSASAYTFDNIGESSNMMIIVISILSASVLSMTLLIILKKKKHK